LCAVSFRMSEVVSALIARGADVNKTNALCETSLGLAATAGDLPMMRLLMKAGALVNPKGTAPVSTPLVQAVVRGNMGGVLELSAHGALVNDILKSGMDPLHFAPYSIPEVVDALIQGGANVEIAAQDGSRPLHEIIKHAPYCHSGYPDPDGNVASKACIKSLLRMVDLFKKRGANLESRDNEGATPLWRVVRSSTSSSDTLREAVAIAAQLLKLGAKLRRESP
jgi:ankyrin repeat protein